MTNVPAKAKESLKFIEAELLRYGITEFELENRGKHPAIRFEWKGEQKVLYFSGTPSDVKGTQRKLRDIRHLLGVVGGPKVVGERRQKKHQAPKSKQVQPPELGKAPSMRGMDEQLAELFGKED